MAKFIQKLLPSNIFLYIDAHNKIAKSNFAILLYHLACVFDSALKISKNTLA